MMSMSMTMASRRKWRALPHSFSASATLALLLLLIILILYTLAPSPRSSHHRPAHPNLRGINVAQDQKEQKKKKKKDDVDAQETLGVFGELMLSFLPQDLPFTIFIPTPSSFESLMEVIGDSEPSNVTSNRNLNLHSNTSYPLQEGKRNHALISRIFAFSAAPIRIESSMIPPDGIMVEVESLSGFRLNLVRIPSEETVQTVRVNNLVCSTVDICRGPIVIHLVEGVLMEGEFERSVMPFKDDNDSDDLIGEDGN